MIRVKVVNPHSIAVTTRMNGQTVYKQTRTLSSDGNLLTVITTAYPPRRAKGSQPITLTTVCRRKGPAPAGTLSISGRWAIEKVSGRGMTTVIKVVGNQMTMTSPGGNSFTARFDGKLYPVKGKSFFNQVALKRINADTIEVIDLRNGRIVERDKLTVHGNTLNVAAKQEPSGALTTYVAHRG